MLKCSVVVCVFISSCWCRKWNQTDSGFDFNHIAFSFLFRIVWFRFQSSHSSFLSLHTGSQTRRCRQNGVQGSSTQTLNVSPWCNPRLRFYTRRAGTCCSDTFQSCPHLLQHAKCTRVTAPSPLTRCCITASKIRLPRKKIPCFGSTLNLQGRTGPMLIQPSFFCRTEWSWSSTQDGVCESAGPICVFWDAAAAERLSWASAN